MANSIIIISIVNLLNQILGFLRDTLVTYYYGASSISDAYIVAVIIPSVIIGVIASGLSAVFVPECIKYESNRSQDEKKYTILMCISSLFVGLLGALTIWCFKDLVLSIFARGFDAPTREMASDFIVITVFSMPLILINNIMSGYFQVVGKQLISSVVIIPSNILGIVIVYFSYQFGNIYLLPLCYLATMVLTFTLNFLLSNIYKVRNIKLRIFEIKDYTSSTYKLALPVMLGVSANQINFVIDRSLATTVYEGAVSLVNISVRVSSIIEVILVTSIMLVYYPILSRMKNNKIKQRFCILELLFILFIAIIPTASIFHFYSHNIIDFLFGRGKFSSDDVLVSSQLLSVYALSIPFVYMKILFSKWMYSQGETKIPTIVSLVGIAINIIFNFLLVDSVGLIGLAISTLISNLITTILSIYIMAQRGVFSKDYISLSFTFLPLFCFILIGYYINSIYQESSFIFLLEIGFGLSIYMTLMFLLVRKLCKIKGFYNEFHLLNKSFL
ncbi:murein biosynthesis integral membrane protein MurJ [Vibrio parahaemolyticus]|uniref:Polysaccharide biosynthesis protein n=2 Tax=Vibrio parahaemolyticus TaxID=670 RepID=A0A5P4SAA5_VIBPH|nr:polysaccharide biosynthesis protein [Vibrio parahaemolyticus]